MSERAAILAEALKGIRERYGHLAVSRGMPDARPVSLLPEPPDPLPTWWPHRLPAGHRVVELAGPASCGKISLALLWLAAADRGGLVAVVDTAGTFYPPAAASAGLDLDRLVVVRPPRPWDAVEAATSLVTAAGFDAVLWPLTKRSRPNAMTAARLHQLASRTQTRVVSLLDRPARADWTGLAVADVRLAIIRHEWQMIDGELAGVDLTVRAERVRGITAQDWSFRLRSVHRAPDGSLGYGLRITGAGASAGTGSAADRRAEVAVAT